MKILSTLAAFFHHFFSANRTSLIPAKVPAHLTSSTKRGHINTNPNWLKIALNQK